MKQEDFRELRYDLVELKDGYNDLEKLVDHADQLDVDVANAPRIEQVHGEFMADLLEHYYFVESVLARAGRIEDPEGRTIHELPAQVPSFVQDRVNNRPGKPETPGRPDTTEPTEPTEPVDETETATDPDVIE